MTMEAQIGSGVEYYRHNAIVNAPFSFGSYLTGEQTFCSAQTCFTS